MSTKALVGLALTAAFSLLSCATPRLELGRPDFSPLADGVYRGSYAGKLGKATVAATLAGGRMLALELTAFESSPLGAPAAKAIPGRVLEAQGLGVDLVSGASYSSQVILKAVEAALAQAPSP